MRICGRGIPILILTSAGAIGAMARDTATNVPKNNFFMMLPPFYRIAVKTFDIFVDLRFFYN